MLIAAVANLRAHHHSRPFYNSVTAPGSSMQCKASCTHTRVFSPQSLAIANSTDFSLYRTATAVDHSLCVRSVRNGIHPSRATSFCNRRACTHDLGSATAAARRARLLRFALSVRRSLSSYFLPASAFSLPTPSPLHRHICTRGQRSQL